MFAHLKLRTKLIGGFGIVLVLLIGVIAIYQYATTSMSGEFNNLLKVDLAIRGDAKDVESAMLQCRRDEKDFLLRMDKKYLDKLNKNVAAAIESAGQIEKLATQAGYTTIAAQGPAIITAMSDYSKIFAQMVEAYEVKGLDHKSGLQGKFRDAALSCPTPSKPTPLMSLTLLFS
ncbi:MAG: MCP four helix bundle domain-containing protein [Proteobacteria bacterium]|nr:MCP four helix bundle domain-containing protein [Pseudomonadota bacterium]